MRYEIQKRTESGWCSVDQFIHPTLGQAQYELEEYLEDLADAAANRRIEPFNPLDFRIAAIPDSYQPWDMYYMILAFAIAAVSFFLGFDDLLSHDLIGSVICMVIGWFAIVWGGRIALEIV